MPISGLALSRTTKTFTDHLKGFELGAITETNPSNGVYRYTFADGTSPYTWAEVATAEAGYGSSGNYGKFGMNIAHVQMNNNTNSGGGFDNLNSDPNYLHAFSNEPKSDSVALVSNVQTLLPTGRYTETSGTFASFLGGTAITNGYNFATFWQTSAERMTTNSAYTVSATGRYVEINWNTVALNETVYTTAQRNFGRTVAGKVKIVFQPYIYFDQLSGLSTDSALYFGKPRYYDTTIAGTNLVALKSSPPSDISTFSNSAGTRTFSWTETDANFANPYLYLWKWNGSTYVQVREGYLSNGSVAFETSPYTKSANFNSYTVPAGDGGGYYYIYLYQYDGYYNTYSGDGTYSGDIFL